MLLPASACSFTVFTKEYCVESKFDVQHSWLDESVVITIIVWLWEFHKIQFRTLDHLNVLPSSNWSLDTLVMASTSTGVIDVQPQLYSNKPPAGSNLLQRRVDENGEEIIFVLRKG